MFTIIRKSKLRELEQQLKMHRQLNEEKAVIIRKLNKQLQNQNNLLKVVNLK